VAPAVAYYRARFDVDGQLYHVVEAFKTARLCDPAAVRLLAPNRQKLDALEACFPFITVGMVEDLEAELPGYYAAASGVTSTVSVLEFWRINLSNLPAWCRVVRLVAHLCPSSAAAERVFSLFKSAFTDAQDCALEDLLESTLMHQYNTRGGGN
jgi:hypothetical protein